MVGIKNDNNFYNEWIKQGKPLPNIKIEPYLLISPTP
jgi:uncharacterized GH25 family protein